MWIYNVSRPMDISIFINIHSFIIYTTVKYIKFICIQIYHILCINLFILYIYKIYEIDQHIYKILINIYKI